jgi:hypothetical protein
MTYGLIRHSSDLAREDPLTEGIDFVFAAGNGAGIKRAMKVCRAGDRIFLLKDMKLSRLLKLAFERAGVTIVQQSAIDVEVIHSEEPLTHIATA